tara:strand:+ start:584 stop:886 length:303 start_codon:yes stop_codon:yes gene_type:complete
MSVRPSRADQPVLVRRGPPLQTAEHVAPQQHASAEYDVLDSGGSWFGAAVQTPTGLCFVRPPELNGVRVMPPFSVNCSPNSERLAASLGATLSRMLLGLE